jgi:transposase
VVIALVITLEGFPLAYEVMDGNTSDRGALAAAMNSQNRHESVAKD